MWKSECQQLICEILRATPEAASADPAVQTARLASKAPLIEKRRVLQFHVWLYHILHPSSVYLLVPLKKTINYLINIS